MDREGPTVDELQAKISLLRAELAESEEQLLKLRKGEQERQAVYSDFTAVEVAKYSRQMIVPQIGVGGQKALKKSKVLIVGVGGLGCPAAQYLAAAGVGEITLLDNDTVEATNLHRQILHSEMGVGSSKVTSAMHSLKRLNSHIKVIPINVHANSHTIEDVIKSNCYSLVIDGTDNVASRYLLNDVCVLNNLPLVSGSALQLEGQLTVYHYKNGPCYRCLFPTPPPANTVTSCGDAGVLGVVPGVIGVLQALEAIKIITNLPVELSGNLLLFDGLTTTFRKVKLRPRKADCEICGDKPKITKLIDYEQFCKAKAHDRVENIDILDRKDSIDVNRFSEEAKGNALVVDVRPALEFAMCRLSNTFNLPYEKLVSGEGFGVLRGELETNCTRNKNVYLICRRGNDSQRAVRLLKEISANYGVEFFNVKGGLHAYAKEIDPSFPIY